ncbi:MAG: LacI family DNA-binding transcriptional regulator [Sphaerochaeta sp.]
MSSKATIQEIATQANVSVATVSRVLNNKSIVKKETKEKVKKAMLELGFDITEVAFPNVEAPSQLLMINLPSISNPFYNEIVKGAKDSASRRGYFLLINSQHLHNSFNTFLYLIKQLKVAGVVMLNPLLEGELSQLLKLTPTVLCSEFIETNPEVSYVGINDLLATEKVMNMILSADRRKIAILSGPMRYKYARERKKGYLLALQAAGIPLLDDWVIQLPEIDFKMAYSICIQLLNSQNRPDAIFTVSDVFAVAAIKAAQTVGLRVPEDVMVTGFDNVNFSEFMTPSITTVQQPKYQLGYIATEMLIDQLEKKHSLPQYVILDTEIIVRESSCKVSHTDK